MDTEIKRKQVNFEQLTALLEFLKDNLELAKGLTRGRRGKFHTLKIWNQCAKKLNTIKDGAHKDGKGWSKYWCDWKYRVRRRALELKAAKDHNRPLPEGTVPLSPMEENILSIIGEQAVEGVTVKSDPLDYAETENEEDTNDLTNGVTLNSHDTRRRSKRRRKRQNSSKDSDIDDGGGPSSPPERKPRLGAPNNGYIDDSDHGDEASQFLRIETNKLEHSRKMVDSLHSIQSELTRLTDIMSDIRDYLINNRVNL